MAGQRLCFGYGSLVNCQTHEFSNAARAHLTGWQRRWSHRVQRPGRSVTSLTIEPAEGVTIAGLICEVAPDQIADLDAREAGYDLVALPPASLNTPLQTPHVHTYVSANAATGDATAPILQTYLDTVLLGFFQKFGADGIDQFIETTRGWETPILQDRPHPLYPRYTALSDEITTLIDTKLDRLGVVQIVQPPQS